VAALDHTVLPRAAAVEAVVRIRHLPSLPRHIQAAVAVEGGVDLVVHEGEEEEVTAPALVAAVWGLAHHLFLPVLARGHVLTAEIKSGSLGRILVRADHLLRNKSVVTVLPLAHGHLLIAGIKSRSLGRVLVRTDHLLRIKHVTKKYLRLTHDRALTAETKSGSRGRILGRADHLLRNKSVMAVLPLHHGHVLIAGIKSGSLGGILVRADHLQQSESVEKVPGSHLPCPSHPMGAELVTKMTIMKRSPGKDRVSEDIHRLVVGHRVEADRTLAAQAAAGVAEGGAHRHPHQTAEVKSRRGERKLDERDHGLRLIQVTVGAEAGVKARTVAVKRELNWL